ncbi:Carnitine O-palmitoyltransferase 2 [Phytophthora rubi]|uniref:Carnitine O-palmitoyltransferase 2 n=1 Tax=Phytophthora rubi TaxID=129364 RepID=A0A6A3L678_9STRA|nr:Carnitine O-palmitoyltransferase 2 [Phytophthora rubi]KAE9014519.1 Carnitine O-palmitoyltransferase 2 [Phytophthora rubi]KAE9297036.1 Carnitine O-palmitoyltransferase 2 [Phytophthora rubi]
MQASTAARARAAPALLRAFSSAGGYVQDTIIPTYHFQKSLTRLPIPKLEDSLARYLAAVEPVVGAQQLADTRRAVQTFQSGVGPELHRALVARDAENKHTSYINQWWLEMYLRDRQPLPINYNPQIKLKMDPVPAKNAQSQRAASLIASSVRVHRTLRDKKLEPDIFHTKPDTSKTKAFQYFCKLLPESVSFYGAAALGAYPLDMSQYKNLFSSTRLPKLGQDELKVSPGSKHVVVQRGTKFYTFDVLTADGGAVSDEQILANIEAILAEPLTKSTPDAPGMGLMTTMNRDAWANARQKLEASGGVNKASLEQIDSALFVVSLEHESPATPEEVSRTFLVGDGTNHWFDKSFQLIVAANGTASVNFEHAWGDGVAVLRYLNELYGDSVKYPVLKANSQAKPKELTWDVNGETKQLLNEAKKTYDKWTSTLLVACAESPVTRAVGKKYNIGTDGLMQMTIQLAHFKLHQKFVATYESASTAAFKHGRTETVRSCTNEAVAFVRTMTNASASDSDKANALRAAVTKHSELTKNGVMGQGFDRHLFALRAMAELQGIAVPEFYTLPAHQTMSKIILSTSTLSSPALEGGSFGPVNEDCYGIGYGIEQEGSAFQLSSYRDDLPQLKELLVESIVDLERLLADTTPKK